MLGEFDITGIIIETDRLILREWKESDVNDFYEYARVDGVGQMAGWQPHESIEKSSEILSHFISEKKTFALEYKESGKVIGSLGIEFTDLPSLRNHTTLKGRELGYVLSKDYWGKGLMTEACKAVIDWAFHNTDWDFITCGHFVHNDRSRRVIEKCGFTFVDEIDYKTRMGHIERSRDYVLYRNDYLNK